MQSSPIPAVLGPYKVLGKLASGGVGELLLAEAPHAAGLVAIKRALPHLLQEEDIASSLLQEARWMKAVRSPRVVGLVALLRQQDQVQLVLEYIHGVSLAYLLDAHARAGERLAPAVALRIGLDALEGLEAIHEAREGEERLRLVHGDLNPRNVVVGGDGGSRVCDLGLSAPERRGAPTEFRGTAAYTAPEVWRGVEQTRRSDLFSAGVLLWEALRGERLFRGPGLAATLHNVVESPAPPLDRGRPDLAPYAAAVARALAKDPAERFGTAREMHDALAMGGGSGGRPRWGGWCGAGPARRWRRGGRSDEVAPGGVWK